MTIPNASIIAALGEVGQRVGELEECLAVVATRAHGEYQALHKYDGRLLATLSREVRRLEKEIKTVVTSLDSIKAAVALAEKTITDQRAQLAAKDQQIADLQGANGQQQAVIADLNAKIAAGDHLTDADVNNLATELTNVANNTPPPAPPAQ